MTNEPAAGLYVHVPFCQSKCPYCDFYSITEPGSEQGWLRCLIREARHYQEIFKGFDSFYLGGGTPSVLPLELLADLVNDLDRLWTFAPATERTIEANPNDLDRERLQAYRALGFNRISVGVQALGDSELARLGRRHRRADTLRALDLVREHGPAVLSIDLIYGFAGQSVSGWLATLAEVLRYRPEHLSCYQLTLAESTPFGRAAAAGRSPAAAADDQAELFLAGAEFLRDHGYLHYEISNFARAFDLRCRHNLKYWNRSPYLGLGPAAHSFRGRSRWWNPPSLADYCRSVEATGSGVTGREVLSPEQVHLEDLALGFRTREGVALEQLGPDSPQRQAALRQLRQAGLVIAGGGRLRPTLRGFLVADRLPLCFSD